MPIYLSETGKPQGALMPFWLLLYLNPNHFPLLTYIRCSTLDLMGNCAKLTVSELIRGSTVKTPGLVTSWRPVANNTRLYAGA